MVGVPGRSRGCLTCRKRKKGCDQQRPVCGQCRRSNLVCQGYPSSLTFVQYHPERIGPSHFTASQDSSDEDSAAPDARADQSLMNTAVDAYMFDNYWDAFFPKAKADEKKWVPVGGMISTWIPAGWIYEMRDFCASDVLIKTGLQANAYSTAGKRNEESRLTVASMQAYSMVLHEVHRSLQDLEKRKNDNVLAACKLLALFEAQQGAGASWERHALGILRLLAVRGAAAHQTGLSHALFLDARYQGIVACIRRREVSFLHEEEWCTVPWAIEEKDFRHEMIDVLTKLPRILQEYDLIKASKVPAPDTTERRAAWFELCNQSRDEAEAWLDLMKTRFDPDRMALLEDGIPENFPLSNVMLAHAMTLYWASVLLINTVVLLGFREFGVTDTSWERSGKRAEITPPIMCIAKSIPYFFQPDAGSICPQSFSFPLGVALNTASYTNVDSTPEYRKLLRAFSKGAMGNMIRSFLTSLKLLADPSEREQGKDDQRALSYQEVRKTSQMYYEGGMNVSRPMPNMV